MHPTNRYHSDDIIRSDRQRLCHSISVVYASQDINMNINNTEHHDDYLWAHVRDAIHKCTSIKSFWRLGRHFDQQHPLSEAHTVLAPLLTLDAPEDIVANVLQRDPAQAMLENDNYCRLYYLGLPFPLHIACARSHRNIAQLLRVYPQAGMKYGVTQGTPLQVYFESFSRNDNDRRISSNDDTNVVTATSSSRFTNTSTKKLEIVKILLKQIPKAAHVVFETWCQDWVGLQLQLANVHVPAEQDEDGWRILLLLLEAMYRFEDVRGRFLPVHAAMSCKSLLSRADYCRFIIAALFNRYKDAAAERDSNGDTPLHIFIKNCAQQLTSFQMKRVLQYINDASPYAFNTRNTFGQSPLELSIITCYDQSSEKIPVHLVKLSPAMAQVRHVKKRIYPFMLAASSGTKCSLNVVFDLLRTNPVKLARGLANNPLKMEISSLHQRVAFLSRTIETRERRITKLQDAVGGLKRRIIVLEKCDDRRKKPRRKSSIAG